jgi:hypothetical protein
MVRKISFLVLSVSILVIGVTAFSKLGYWDRSVRIFSFSSDASVSGRMDRGHGERGGFARPDSRILPDSIRARYGERQENPGALKRNRNIPDSLGLKPELRDKDQAETGINNIGIKDGQGHRGGEFRGGKKINLKNVLWFLAVFASFTVVTRYADKGISLIRKRKARKEYLRTV